MEADFAFLGWDYRDRYRPKGGQSQLTMRRLLLLVDSMDRFTSRFWSQVGDFDPISTTDILLSDIWAALAGQGKAHLIRTRRERAAAEEAREKKKKRIEKLARQRRKMLASQQKK